MPSDTTVADSTVYGWDWSSTTHAAHAETRDVLHDLTRALGGVHVLPGKGWQGWGRSAQVFDCEGYKLGQVFYGSKRNDLHVLATSSAADLVRGDVVAVHGPGTARVDTRVDSLVPWDDLTEILFAAADRYGSTIRTVEGFKNRESTGRTVYLGAPKSAIQVRLYEKWLESPGQYVEGTNRVEVQLRPPSKAKQAVSEWSRGQTFCASRVTRDLAERLGADLAPKASLHVKRGTPDLERSLEAMGEQYGKAAARWLEQSGGDMDTVLDYLLSKIAE